jgi:hypothetical protein
VRGCVWILGPRVPLAVLALALFLALFAPKAAAQGALPLELSWQAPDHCPSAADVHAELERIAHARPGLTLEPLRANAEVTLTHKRYVLNVVTEHQGQRGERRVEARDCKTVVRTLTLILALTFGAGVELSESASAPGDASAEPVAEPPPPPPPKPAPAPPPVETRADVAPDKPRGPRPWLVLAGGGALWGAAPRAAGMLSLGVERELGALSLGVRGLGALARAEQPRDGVNAHFAGLGAALQGCGRLALASLSGALCASARALALRGRADGDIQDAEAVAPWYALSAGAALTWPRDFWLRVRVEGALALSLNRPRFIIEGLSQVHRVPRLAPELGLALLFAL